MDIAELFGRGQANTGSDLPDDLAVPDYPPDGDSDDSSESLDLLEPDPAPRRSAKGTARAVAHKVTVGQRRQITDAVDLMLTTLGGGLAFRDPHCGGAISEHATNIAAKLTPIIARNPRWVDWFCGSTGFLDVMGLMIAVRPVLGTFWSHHVTHTVDDEGGGVDLAQFTAPDL